MGASDACIAPPGPTTHEMHQRALSAARSRQAASEDDRRRRAMERHAGDASPAAPLLHLATDESNPQKDFSADVAFRHSWWRPDRLRVHAALEAIFPSSKRLDRFRRCGDAAWVYVSLRNPDSFKLCSDTCRDRWCRACQADRSRIMVANLRLRIAELPCKLITLTLRHRDQPLRHQLDRLLECFRTLRRRRLWMDNVRGGVAFVEIKWKPETQRWHPHLHAICDADYIANGSLHELWRAITGDSHHTDIRRIKDIDRVAHYVTKYATKPLDVALYRDPRRLREAITALQGRHLAMTFGSFRTWKLTETIEDGDWELVASLETLQVKALRGDARASFILEALPTRHPEESKAEHPP